MKYTPQIGDVVINMAQNRCFGCIMVCSTELNIMRTFTILAPGAGSKDGGLGRMGCRELRWCGASNALRHGNIHLLYRGNEQIDIMKGGETIYRRPAISNQTS